MRLVYDQLFQHLQRNLSPVYLVAGDETLFIQEASDAIRSAAQKAEFSERLQFSVDSGFDWLLFKEMSMSGSLFSDKQCLELHLLSPKLSEDGKKILLDYLAHPLASKLLIILTPKLDGNAQKSAWVKAVEKVGVFVTVWPLQGTQLVPWIVRRLQKYGLQADPDGVEFLAACTQGNLLATAREIEKLALLYPAGRLTLEQIRESTVDGARYDVFDLVDVVLQGNANTILRVLDSLKEETAEPTLILWALNRALQQLLQLFKLTSKGQSLAQIFHQRSLFVFEKHKPWIGRTLKRHSLKSLQCVLDQVIRAEQVIKGAMVGSVWDELLDISLAMSGFKLPYLST